jgi:hypothetical protein
MKYFLSSLCLLAVLHADGKPISLRCAGSTIVLMDSTSAALDNSRPDAYTATLTPFDLAIRFDKAPGSLSQKDYLSRSAHEMRDWSADEQSKLKEAFGQIEAYVKKTGLHLHMPDTVKLIRTAGAEEFGAEGYTRGNRIMLNTGVQPIDLHLVAHELWHVISRMNENVRNDAYAVFHFKPCNNIDYKGALKGQVITNPDCPTLQHYVSVSKDGKTVDVAPVLYTKEAYSPGFSAMQHASIALLALTGDDSHKQPMMKEGQAVVYEFNDVPDFFQKAGMNTQYVLHIEEITAEHFAALLGDVKMRQMEYVDGLKAVLIK